MAQPAALNVTARFQTASKQFDRGEFAAAQSEFAALAVTAPNVPEIAVMQGRVASRLALHSEAAAHFERAVSLKPKAPAVLAELATAQTAAAQPDAAIATYDKIAALDPKSLKWPAEKALLLQQIGAFDQAGRILRRLIKKAPHEVELFRILVQGEKLKPGDPLIRKMQDQVKNAKLPDRAQVQLAYALAKVMADTGRHDQVFSYLRRANTRQRGLYPFDFADMARDAASLIAAQDAVTFPPIPETYDLKPIFIVGTPRSGTTLVERILSAHKDVVAAGETGLATRGASVLMGKPGAYTPLKDVPSDLVAGYAQAYDRHIRRLADVVACVTDKSMMTHLILGLIRVAIPSAKVIVVHRDPRDVAVSIYRNNFAEGQHRYGNDLGDIARFIDHFRRTIQHWQGILPEPLFELNYEDLVADPEAQTRALVAAAGLPWDAACLASHQTGGAVKTLSLHQVRQPIYTDAARGWTRYADDLKPFDTVWESLNGAE